MFGGIGSEAISAVPVRANTRSTSGTFSRIRVSRRCCMSTDCVRLVPGTRKACRAKSPSLRLGTNSLPMRLVSTPLNTITPSAAPIATARWDITQVSAGA
ncbi:hypothetical protein D3C85_1478810 [compost metagenome]